MRPIWREYYPRENTTLLMEWAWAVAFDVFAKSCCDLYPKLLAINAVIVVPTWTTSPNHQINATLKHFSNGSTMRVSIPRDAG